MTRQIHIKTKIHSHAYPIYIWHWSWGTSCFRLGNSVSQQTELLVICWWQMSDYVTASKNDTNTNANFVLLRPRWGARGWFAILRSEWIVPRLSRTSLKQVASSLGTFSVGRPVTSNNTSWRLLSAYGQTMRAFIKRMPVKQCLWINSPLKIRHKSQYQW